MSIDYLVTGAAGFIGAKVCEMLLEKGHRIVGVDNLNDAYDVRLKEWRLEQLRGNPSFSFHPSDINGLLRVGCHVTDSISRQLL